MPQDAFTLKHIKNKLKSALVGGKISKINQPTRDTLTFIIYTAKGTLKLDICLSAQTNGIIITKNEKSNPQVAPNFCMLLRKHLQNAEITGIEQIDFERVIYFDLNCFSEFEQTAMRLYIEIMGKYSNAILTKDGIIVGALKMTALTDDVKRTLFSGVKYELPTPQDKADPTSLSALKVLFEREFSDAVKFICDNVKGIAYTTALDMVEFYGEGITAEQVYEYVNSERIEPCVVYQNGAPSDFAARSCSDNIKLYDDIMQAQEAYYSFVTSKRNFEDKKRKLFSALNTAIKKCDKRRAQIEGKLAECSEAENTKLKGELITANIYALERGMKSFEAVNYYDEKGGKIKIDLDTFLSPAQNAQKYYKKYAKLKRTQDNLEVQSIENEDKSDYLDSILSSINTAEEIDELIETEEELKSLGLIKTVNEGKRKSKPQTSKFRQYLCGGFKIISGCNNLQNDRLLKSVSGADLWLHTQKFHSSHVAIITEGKTVTDDVLLVAAQICAYYSDGRSANKVPVDYTLRKFVKKPPKSNAGFVIYTDYKTVLVEPNAHEKSRIN